MEHLGKCDARCPANALVLVEKLATCYAATAFARRGGVLLLAFCGADFRRHEVGLLLDGWHISRDNRHAAATR